MTTCLSTVGLPSRSDSWYVLNMWSSQLPSNGVLWRLTVIPQWPGYAPWSKQIPTRDFRTPPQPITRSKLAKNVAKTVKRFIEVCNSLLSSCFDVELKHAIGDGVASHGRRRRRPMARWSRLHPTGAPCSGRTAARLHGKLASLCGSAPMNDVLSH